VDPYLYFKKMKEKGEFNMNKRSIEDDFLSKTSASASTSMYFNKIKKRPSFVKPSFSKIKR